jgi:hypothetical protein
LVESLKNFSPRLLKKDPLFKKIVDFEINKIIEESDLDLKEFDVKNLADCLMMI